MIETADLQAFIEKIQGGTVPVDLLKIGQTHHAQSGGNSSSKKFNNNNQHGKLRIALDLESCLDRFYGGYYSDWACGGQWNRAYQFVQLLVNAFSAAHVDVIAFFDGTLKENKKNTHERNEVRQKTASVLKHIRMIGTPPPKIWWLPPSGLRTCLRNALRSLNVVVVQTVCDHTMEIIEYFNENKLDAILGLNPDYVIANTCKYYSSHDLRLSYKGSLETKEFLVSKLLSNLSLTPDHLPFMAVFLGGYILIDEKMLRSIYQKINVDFASDFETRIRRIAEIVRNSPTNEIEEFIRHLALDEWAKEVRDSVEYYQRKARFSLSKKLSGKRKTALEIQRISESVPTAPLASEANETDEITRKILHDVSNLVDEGEPSAAGGGSSDTDAPKSPVEGQQAVSTGDGAARTPVTEAKATGGRKPATFVYALPGEVLKTSLNRHQRGIMDSRIYQLLTKKEIILPQVLEDEQYREIPSIHLFYRPARQYIYAILFNLFHQKYLCYKNVTKERGAANRSGIVPEVLVAEWIWSPQNEFRKPEMVNAIQLPWAVPTIQRLWFGMAFEDKQRRMKAFLTVMRSDTPLMLNRSYVPQHMLVMACVLRYIVTSPDRNILTRPELDAFLATAFSPHIVNVDYTQELVLPGIHLRGVYLATLFMQGVETASLANDACGVPLPWMMTNPWLFFDGKLFHLKLKMSTYAQTLRDLCDNHIEIVLKIERFRKAILEDVEHYLLPAHMDPLYRANYPHSPLTSQSYGKNALHSIANIPSLSNGSTSTAFYNSVQQQQQQQQSHQSYSQSSSNSHSYYNASSSNRSTNYRNRYGNNHQQQHAQQHLPQSHPLHQSNQLITRQPLGRQGQGYQLKVGGVVVGSWAGGDSANRGPAIGGGIVHNRFNRNALAASLAGNNAGANFMRYPLNARNRMSSVNTRLQRNIAGHGHVTSLSRTISRNTYGKQLTRNKNRRTRNKERKGPKSGKSDNEKSSGSESDENKNEDAGTPETAGTTIQTSTLVKSMCHNILKEEDDDIPASDGEKSAGTPAAKEEATLAEQNGNISTKLATLSLDDDNKSETITATNGNNIESEAAEPNDNAVPEVTATNKKKGKKAAANNNNNNSAESAEGGKDDAVDTADNHKSAPPSDELINDANSATVQV